MMLSRGQLAFAKGCGKALIALTLLLGALGSPAQPAPRRTPAAPGGADLRGDDPSREECAGDKNQSVLVARLKVVGGRLAVDKEASKGSFQPSDLFKCRMGLGNGGRKGQEIEQELLDDLDKALRNLPRFYLSSLTIPEAQALIRFLPEAERNEVIYNVSLRKEHLKGLFLYLPEEKQLDLVDDLRPAEKKEFFAYLPAEIQDKVLEGLPEVERQALRAKEKAEPPRGAALPNDAERKAVGEYPTPAGGEKKSKAKSGGTWEGFVGVYSAWNASRPEAARPEGELNVALQKFLGRLQGKVLSNSPLHAYSLSDDGVYDGKLGRFSLKVTDPIGDLSIANGGDETGGDGEYKIIVGEKSAEVSDAEYITPSKDKIGNILKPLKGELWRCRRIEAYINDYFVRARSGYERSPAAFNALEVCAQEAQTTPKVIRIPAVPTVNRISFYGEIEEKDIRAALRQLLDDKELKRYRQNPKLLKDCEGSAQAGLTPHDATAPAAADGGITIKCRYISYQDLAGGEGTFPYLNLENWRQQQAALASDGFVAFLRSFVPPSPPGETEEGTEPGGEGEEPAGEEAGDDNQGEDGEDKISPQQVEIRIVKGDAAGESLIKSASESAGGGAAADGGGNTTASGGDTPPNTSAAPSNSGSAATAGSGDAGSGGGATEGADSKFLRPKRNYIGGGFAYRPDQGVRALGQYTRSRPGADNFTVTAGGFGGLIVTGEYEGKDLFGGMFGSEFPFSARGFSDSVASRILNGVKVDDRRTGAAFRVQTDLKVKPTQLTLSFEGRHETVELASDNVVTAKQNLSTLTFGAIYGSSSEGVRLRRVWQVEPKLRLGLGLADRPAFSVLRVDGLLNQSLPGYSNLIFEGRFDLASRRTPLFEQPSFGGEETVRGFRADDAIGRRQWVIKSEANVPVPFTSPDGSKLSRLLRYKFQLAVFADVGGIYKTTGSAPGVRLGPGAGMRFNYQGAVLKFDWAYGLGDAVNGRGRGRFYFSISREIPRLLRSGR